MHGALVLSLELGLLYSLVAFSLVLSFRFLEFPDLSIDGTFTTGAATFGACVVTWNWSPWLALIAAILAGSLAGGLTGFLSSRFNLAPLLSGILVLTMLYSINLRIMGQANISLLGASTLLSPLRASPHREALYLVTFGLVSVGIFGLLLIILHTEFGTGLRATGDNARFVTLMGWSPRVFVVTGIALANGVAALAGALVAQRQGFADVNMGFGMLILALASLVIGDALLPGSRHQISRLFLAAVIGAVGYQFAVALGLAAGLRPGDLRLVTGLLVLLALGFGRLGRRLYGNPWKLGG